MRKFLWRCHAWLGLTCGLALLLIGLSGSLLVFRTEIDAWLDRGPQLPSSIPATRLGFDGLFAAVRLQYPAYEVVGWEVARRPQEADLAALQPRGSRGEDWRWVRVDPANGRVLSPASAITGRRFTAWLLDLHVSFFLSAWGTVLNGFFALALCILGVSGLWLHRHLPSTLLRLRWRRPRRVLLSDFHKAIGASSVLFNLILGFTGAYWNLPTLASLLARSPSAAPPPAVSTPFYDTSLSIDSLVAQARTALPALGTERFYLNLPPRYAEISVRGELPTRNPFRSNYAGEVTFDPTTGRQLAVSDFRQAALWSQIEDMMGSLHFGTFGGWLIKIAWCLGGLTPGLLAISGFLIRRMRVAKIERTPGEACP